jgi:hypothetical protein
MQDLGDIYALKKKFAGQVAHTCNPSTPEAEAGGSQVLGQPGLHQETLPQNYFFLKCVYYLPETQI